MQILITGGTGTLGRSLVVECLRRNLVPIVLSNDENQIYEMRSDFSIKCILADVRDLPDINCDYIIHCAALKHVLICEENPVEAIKTNILGSMNVINKGKRCIAVSTDKAVEPINVYGATKLIMERLFLKAGYPVIRFGNFWASRGSVIPLWEKQMKLGFITITDPNMKRYWIKPKDAARYTLDHLDSPAGIYIPEMECLSVGELADRIAPCAKRIIIGNRGSEKIEEKLE